MLENTGPYLDLLIEQSSSEAARLGEVPSRLALFTGTRVGMLVTASENESLDSQLGLQGHHPEWDKRGTLLMLPMWSPLHFMGVALLLLSARGSPDSVLEFECYHSGSEAALSSLLNPR